MKITKDMLITDCLPSVHEKDGYVNCVLALFSDKIYCESNTYIPKWTVCNTEYYRINADEFEGWIDLEELMPNIVMPKKEGRINMEELMPNININEAEATYNIIFNNLISEKVKAKNRFILGAKKTANKIMSKLGIKYKIKLYQNEEAYDLIRELFLRLNKVDDKSIKETEEIMKDRTVEGIRNNSNTPLMGNGDLYVGPYIIDEYREKQPSEILTEQRINFFQNRKIKNKHFHPAQFGQDVDESNIKGELLDLPTRFKSKELLGNSSNQRMVTPVR